MRVGPCGHAGRHTVFPRVEAYIDLIVVEIHARNQHGRGSSEPVRMHVLRIGALLQPRIMLLEGIAVDGVVQVVSEIGIKIE